MLTSSPVAVKVELPLELRRRMKKALSRAGRREIGGILMAEQIEAGHFRIVDFTVDKITGSAAHSALKRWHPATKQRSICMTKS